MSTVLKRSTFATKFEGEGVVKEMVKKSEHARVVQFFVKQGERVKPHTAPSEVHITVLQGRGKFVDGDPARIVELEAGESILHEAGELHGFEALENLVVQAVITP